MFEQTSKTTENGYESPKTECGLVSSQESLSKKKRKKKKQNVKRVIIEDPDDYGGFEDTERTENSPTVEHSTEETSMRMASKDRNLNDFHENDNGLENNPDESSLVKDNQSGEGILSDVRTNTHGSLPDDHATSPANDNKVTRTDDQLHGLKEKSDQKVFASAELDHYTTVNGGKNSEINNEFDSLEKTPESSHSRLEFSANDFLLDQTEPQSQNIVTNLEDIETSNHLEEQSSFSTKDSSMEAKGDNVTFSLQQNCEHSDYEKENSDSRESEKHTSEDSRKNEGPSGINEQLTRKLSNSNGSYDSSSFPKTDEKTENSEQDDTSEELLETPKHKDYSSQKFEKLDISSKERAESNDEFSEILSSGNSYDYRVRKVENPEFISSSYGSSSALSDYTDDDRDLNFIPGIHRMSSKSFSSSFEKRSAADSSVSFDENGFPVFDSSHYTDSSASHPSSIDDSSGSRFGDLSNEWDMFEDLLNVEEEHFSQPDVSTQFLSFAPDVSIYIYIVLVLAFRSRCKYIYIVLVLVFRSRCK